MEKDNCEVRVSLLSSGYIESIRKQYDAYFTKRPYPFDLDEVQTGLLNEELENGIAKYSFLKLTNLKQFSDLASCEVFSNGEPFPFTSYDIHKLNPKRVLEVRNILLDLYYNGLKEIGDFIGANQIILDNAYNGVRDRNWFTKESIGNIVLSRGKSPRKAQLVALWETDFIYHIARVFQDDGTSIDVVFMIYWRNLRRRLFESPGKLSWINYETLKFIPKSADDYSFAFKVDKGAIDFAYYLNPNGKRAFQFCTHLIDSGNPTNLLKLNY